MQETEIQNQTAAPAAEAIIRAERVEKYYAQPSQNRIQVISPTDLAIVPGKSYSPRWVSPAVAFTLKLSLSIGQ